MSSLAHILWPIEQFSEAVPFIIFHAWCHERLQVPLLGRFLSRHWFMLCIITLAKPKIAKQYKCHHCCVCKKIRGKVMNDGKKCLHVTFWLTIRSRVHEREKSVSGHPTAWARSYCSLPDTLQLWTFITNAFKAGIVNFANSLSSPSIVKKVCTGSQNGQGT